MEGGLVAAMLSMLGLEEKDVKDSDKLASFGVDSMQLAEIRSRLQRAMGRPIPLEEVSCFNRSALKTRLHLKLLVCPLPQSCAVRHGPPDTPQKMSDVSGSGPLAWLHHRLLVCYLPYS